MEDERCKKRKKILVNANLWKKSIIGNYLKNFSLNLKRELKNFDSWVGWRGFSEVLMEIEQTAN